MSRSDRPDLVLRSAIELPDWPSVTVDRFAKSLETRDYERASFRNAIEFIDRRNGTIIGYEIGSAVQRGYLLNPILAVQE